MPSQSPNTLYTKHRTVQFAGPTTSDDYNSRIEENHNDLVVAFNRARLSEVEVQELYSRMLKEHLSISRVIDSLHQRIQTLENEQNRFVFHSMDQIDNQRFDEGYSQFHIPVDESLSFDPLYGTVTLPMVETSSISKLFYVDDEGEEVVPGGFEGRVVGSSVAADGSASLIDSSPLEYALLNKPGLIWERNVVSPDPNPNGAEATVYFRAPTNLFTTQNANAIRLHPFPHFGTNIKRIEYTTRVNPTLTDTDQYIPINEDGIYAGEPEAIGWVAPGGWKNQHQSHDTIENAGPKYFVFPPQPITAIRVVLHQPRYLRQNGKAVYSYGMSHFDLRYHKFLSEGSALIRFDAPPGQTINQITGVYPQIWNVPPHKLVNVIDFEVVWETAPGSNEPTSTPQIGASRVWLKMKMMGTPNWSPVLSGLVLDYIPGAAV